MPQKIETDQAFFFFFPSTILGHDFATPRESMLFVMFKDHARPKVLEQSVPSVSAHQKGRSAALQSPGCRGSPRLPVRALPQPAPISLGKRRGPAVQVGTGAGAFSRAEQELEVPRRRHWVQGSPGVARNRGDSPGRAVLGSLTHCGTSSAAAAASSSLCDSDRSTRSSSVTTSPWRSLTSPPTPLAKYRC